MKNNNVHTQLKGGPNQTWSHKTKASESQAITGEHQIMIWIIWTQEEES